ncbi:MAG: protein kinase [Phormidesmis sp.]
MSSLIGKRLQGGKYKLEAVLGRGGFGLTFRAHQTFLDQVVVIKTLNESFWRDPNLNGLQQQFQDEARRLAMCSHPNVVRVSDFFVEDQLPYMVMDYIPGRSLYDIVLPENSPPQPLSETDAIAYTQQIGKALQAVHAKGLLHRDVKPQNIMIHQLTGEAVLIDFGIARELTRNPTQTHTSIVSEGYAPIEQYLPKAQRSAATDIYGLAATLYTLLTGVIPVAAVLRDRNPLAPIQQLRPDVSAGVADAIAQGMQIELKDRPQSVGRWSTSLSNSRSNGPSNSRSQPRTAQKTARQTASRQPPSDPSGPTPSEFPTQVVAPQYPAGNQAGYRAAPTAGNSKTRAVPLPAAYQTETAANANQPRAKKKGGGCFSSLLILTLLIAGIAAAGGYGLVRQFADVFSGPSAPEIDPGVFDEVETADTPEAETTDPAADADEADQTAEDGGEVEDDDDAKKPKKPKKDELDEEIDPAPSVANQPPLLLGGSGNPANAQPGGTGEMVAVPGFAPGDSISQVRSRLGSPTQAATVDGYDTDVYNVVPNRVRLAYAYEPGSERVVQSEATFAAAVDRLVMRTALLGMLDGRSTREIEQGLEAVRTGERDRFDFDARGFTGAIERNAYGYIHIYVQN